MQQNKVLLSDIAIMRPILIISIILGHSFAMFGGSASWPLLECVRQIDSYGWITPTLISFALQAFVFVSGYLFAYKNPNSAPAYKSKFMYSRAKRILVPSVIFSVLYVLLLTPQNFNKVSVVFEIVNGAGHLWFLPMLFWCYTFGVLFYNCVKKPSVIVGALLLIFSFASFVLPDYLRIALGIHYFPYFVLGMWTFSNKNKILDWINKRKYLLLSLWIIVIILCVCKVKYSSFLYIPEFFMPIIKVTINIMLGLFGSMALWSTINIILNDGRVVRVRGDIWFGLYIYHQFIMMWLYYHTVLPNNVCAEWLPWVCFALTFVSSYLLVVLTLKSRIGRWLIG